MQRRWFVCGTCRERKLCKTQDQPAIFNYSPSIRYAHFILNCRSGLVDVDNVVPVPASRSYDLNYFGLGLHRSLSIIDVHLLSTRLTLLYLSSSVGGRLNRCSRP